MSEPGLRPDYPEHAKLTASRRLSDITQELGAWLEDNGIALCEMRCIHCGKRSDEWDDRCRTGLRRTHEDIGEYGVQWQPIRGSINEQLARIFGVDLNRLEREKRAMLADHVAKMAVPR